MYAGSYLEGIGLIREAKNDWKKVYMMVEERVVSRSSLLE
jgi:hypothetical protein